MKPGICRVCKQPSTGWIEGYRVCSLEGPCSRIVLRRVLPPTPEDIKAVEGFWWDMMSQLKGPVVGGTRVRKLYISWCFNKCVPPLPIKKFVAVTESVVGIVRNSESNWLLTADFFPQRRKMYVPVDYGDFVSALRLPIARKVVHRAACKVLGVTTADAARELGSLLIHDGVYYVDQRNPN